VFPEGARLVGEVRGAGDLVVRGTIEGAIDLDGALTVEATGLVKGEVRARSMILRGRVEGPVVVLELLRLDAGARLAGDVVADRVSAAGGSLLSGRVRMTGAERLKRTAGGTITAPFTSSGTIAAPRSSSGTIAAPAPPGELRPPHEPQRPTALPPESLGGPAAAREASVARPSPGAAAPLLSVAPQHAVVTLPSPASPIAAITLPIPASSPAAITLPAPEDRASKGPPAVPRLGRVQSRGRS
jgi:cytoskeletal protein CcmA (bactofilin family)